MNNHHREMAAELDRDDPLASWRSHFHLPSGQIYLDGNSLGLLSHQAEASLQRCVEQWKTLAIGGWLEADPPWFELAEQIGARLAPLVGALPSELIVTSSTTVNLHQLIGTFYDPQDSRRAMVIDATAFPTDHYVVQSQLLLQQRSPQADLRLVQPGPDGLLSEQQIEESFEDDVQLALLPAVVYHTGQLLDVDRLTAAAHQQNIRIGFDCSHSAGVVPHRLHDAGVDFATFCTYKYLNAGPGAPAALFLHQNHFGRLPAMAGWFGNRKQSQFAMRPTFDPEPTAGGLQLGTPHVLSLAPLLGSLQLIEAAGIERIRAKSLRLTQFLQNLLQDPVFRNAFQIVIPDASRRGGHLAVRHSQAGRISAALRRVGVVPDYRPPDLLRLAPSPLYTSFSDCHCAAVHLQEIVEHPETWGEVSEDRIP